MGEQDVLFVYDSWDMADCGLTGFHVNVVKHLAAKMGQLRVHCIVLDATDGQREDAENAGIHLFEPRKFRLRYTSKCLDWLILHKSFYPGLKNLQSSMRYVVGYSPKTVKGAACIKDEMFPNARLYLINHDIHETPPTTKGS